MVLLLGILFFAYLYFLRDKPKEKPEYTTDYTLRSISNIPEYLQLEKLEFIDGMPVSEYIQSLFIKFYPKTKSEAFVLAKEEIERRFFSEKALVLVTLLELYNNYFHEVEKINNNENLDGYTRKKLSLEKRREIFGVELENYLFPNREIEKIELFFLYTRRYVNKHREDEPSEIRDHLLKAKQEIYGEDYEKLVPLEPFDKRFELELLIQERDMSILNDEERRIRIQQIKKEVSNSFMK